MVRISIHDELSNIPGSRNAGTVPLTLRLLPFRGRGLVGARLPWVEAVAWSRCCAAREERSQSQPEARSKLQRPQRYLHLERSI